MLPLYNLFNDIKKIEQKENNNIELIINNPIINRDYFKYIVTQLDNISEMKLIELINNGLDNVIDSMLEEDAYYNIALRNTKFLDCFLSVIYSNRFNLDYKKILCCNKLAYNNLTLNIYHTDEVVNILLNLSYTVNDPYIDKLVDIGIPYDKAALLTIDRFSTDSDIDNTERLNIDICSLEPELMTEQRIIWIYEALYDHISELFEGIMFEYYTDDEVYDYGEDFMEIYYNISLAILSILNNMTSGEIFEVLRRYYLSWKYRKEPPVRFSMKNLNKDFDRINVIIKYMNNINIILP